MKIHSLLAVGAAASMAVVSWADFTQVSGEVEDLGDFYVVNLFVNFDDPNNVLLNLFDVDLGSLSFNHSDTAFATGGSFNYLSTVNIPGFADPTLDSYVTIGTEAASLDPGFGDGSGGLVPNGAGWFDGTPTSYVQGETIAIGQFVFANTGEEITFSFDGTIGYKGQPDHTNVSFAEGTYSVTVPAPGALALLGLGGLAARRRRA